MLKIIILLAIVGLVLCLLIRPVRDWLVEQIKAASDLFVVFLLRSTSQFGSELTEDGKKEQALWREQRWRNLRGLTVRSEQRWARKAG